MKKIKCIYIFVLMVITSCTKDSLDYELSSSVEADSGVELFVVDSISYNPGNHQVYFHFNIKTGLLPEPVRNVAIYRDGFLHVNLPPGQLDHYLDTGVPGGYIYKYQFALWNTDGALSKLSIFYEVNTQ